MKLVKENMEIIFTNLESDSGFSVKNKNTV